MNNRMWELLDAYLEQRLSELERDELQQTLRDSAEARRLFWEYVEQHALLEDVLAETRGRDLALVELGAPAAEPNRATSSYVAWQPRRFWLWSGVLAALTASLLLTLSPWRSRDGGLLPERQPEICATVCQLAGDVQTTDPVGHWVVTQADSRLLVGQELRVGDEDSFAELCLADGTHVVLASGTNVRFPTADRRLHVEKGAVQVQPAVPAIGPLVVTTDHGSITGAARYRLYRELNASRVELEEGKVRLDRQHGEPVEVTEGLFVIATAEAQPILPQALMAGHAQLRHTLRNGGNAVAFSADGARLAAYHHSRGWKVWHTGTGTLAATAAGSGSWPEGLAFAPLQDAVLALGNGAALLWKPGEPRAFESRLRDKDVRHGAISGNGCWLAQATRKGEVAVWEADPASGNISLRRSFTVQPSRVALERQGSHVAVSQWAGDLRTFEVATGREVTRYKLKRTPTPLALSAGNRYVAAYAHSDGLALFDQDTGTRTDLWPGEGARVACLEFAADGRVLFAGLEDGTVRAWSTADGTSLLVLDTGHRSVNRVTATLDLSLLATVGDSDCVKIWECRLP